MSPATKKALLAKTQIAMLAVEKTKGVAELVIDSKWKIELEIEAFEKSGVEGKKLSEKPKEIPKEIKKEIPKEIKEKVKFVEEED